MTNSFPPFTPGINAKSLVADGVLAIRWSDWLEKSPENIPPGADLADRAEGMMLGLAVGDSLGNTSESMLRHHRHEVHGLIEHYLPNSYAGFRRVGVPSDDTQMACWILEHLLTQGRLEPHALGAVFASRRIFGMGNTVREFRVNFSAGVPWHEAGPRSSGNGALMRVAPILLPYLRAPGEGLWNDTLLVSHLTHNDELSNVACLAFVDLLWRLIGMKEIPSGDWWLDTFTSTCRILETGKAYVPRAGHPENFEGSLSDLLSTYLRSAIAKNLPVHEACATWHSGAYLLETVPCVIYILARHGHDPVAAMLAAVNETKDNDTIAAIVGAAMGALHGRRAIPERWVADLLGRTAADDDGRLFELLTMAGERFGYGVSDALRERLALREIEPLTQKGAT